MPEEALPQLLDHEVGCYRELIAGLQRRKLAILAAATDKIATHGAWLRQQAKGRDKKESARLYVRIRDQKGTFSPEWRVIGFIRDRSGRAWRRDLTIPLGENSHKDLKRLLAQAVDWERAAVLELATQLQDYRREWHYLTEAQRDILRAKDVLGIPDFYLFPAASPAAAVADPDAERSATVPVPATPGASEAKAPNSPYSPSYLRQG